MDVKDWLRHPGYEFDDRLHHCYVVGRRVIRIPGAEFIGCFLRHVLPTGFKRIRHYGLLSPAYKRECLALVRQALQVLTPSALTLEAAEVHMQ